MAFAYQACSDGPIRQGELLGEVIEYRVVAVTEESGVPDYAKISHPVVIVVAQDCDLEQDHRVRTDTAPEVADTDNSALSHVLMCDAASEDEVRTTRGLNSKEWKQVRQNQNERYHAFDEAPVGETEQGISTLIIDFRRHFTLPSAYLYALAVAGTLDRLALLPPFYSHDLMQRFYSYQSRIAIP